MKKLVTFCVAITLLLTQVAGQSTGTIKGKVLDEGNREALFGAMVVVTTGQVNIGCQTDPDGNYIIKPLNSGIYTIKISSMGYQTTIVKDIIVNPGKITFVEDTYLGNVGITLDDSMAVIRDFRDPLIRPDPLTIIRPEEYQDIPGKRDLSGVISKLNSDVYSDEQGELYFRGARNDNFVYVVDGVKSMDNKAHIPSGAIGSIAIYTGGVPANYGDFTGGCVVIETKSFFSR